MASTSEMSDENFLISKVLSHLETDMAAAKSWMIFTKSVFPKSFPVLFQSYKMERDEKNLAESALCLSDLIKMFPNEITLIKELQCISGALYSDTDDFSRNLFEQLSEDTKYDIMTAVTRNARSVEEHCELKLMFMKKIPNAKFMQHGSNIIETLLSAEDQPGMTIPINRFRKMLVCDALPLILEANQYDYKFKVIFQLFQKAVEFYVCCLFTQLSPHNFSVRKEITSSPDNNPNEVWEPLLKLFETVALKYGWNYPEMFISNFTELSLQQLLSLLKRKNKLLSSLTNEKHKREETVGFEEAYFCLVVTFFYYLFHFGRLVHSKLYSSVVTGPYNYVLMEGISFLKEDCPKAMSTDFKRTDREYLLVNKCGTLDSNLLDTSFATAAESWELLHHHRHMKKEFTRLCASVKLETWPVFQEFFTNSLIYRKSHRDAIDHLSRIHDCVTDIMHKNKISLQIASCYYFIKDYECSLKILFDIVLNLQPDNDTNPVRTPVSKCPTRYVYFMRYNNSEILQYCVSMLLRLYKNKEKEEDCYKDMILGYMLVLMQYNLENEYPLLKHCLEAIENAKSFSFPKFFNFIIHTDILEEIAYLANPLGGNVKLDILSTPTFHASKQRAVTRGVNKGAKDDLKQAFINQMSRCYDNLDNLFINFFKEEHDFLLLLLKGATKKPV